MATNFYLRDSLTLLPTKIKDVKSDIINFNDYINTIVLDFATGGETSDLIVYLFKSYLIIKDKVFNQVIINKKEKYNEDDPTITPKAALMDMALNKYNTVRQSKTWRVKTPEEE